MIPDKEDAFKAEITDVTVAKDVSLSVIAKLVDVLEAKAPAVPPCNVVIVRAAGPEIFNADKLESLKSVIVLLAPSTDAVVTTFNVPKPPPIESFNSSSEKLVVPLTVEPFAEELV